MENTKEINFDRRKFKKVNGEFIEDLIDYISNILNKSNDIKIIVGCDSQQKRSYTLYALTIIFYDDILHKGAHVIYMKIRTKKERELINRLYQESLYSLSLSEWLEERLDGIYNMPKFKPNEYDKSIPTKKIEIHVDINPHSGKNKKNKSNTIYSSVMGMLCGSGYSVKCKPTSYAASSAADSFVKK